MAKVRGHVDGLGRPVIPVVSAKTGDPFLATVDTGFNGTILTSAFDAPSLGVQMTAKMLRVQLGDGRTIPIRAGRLILTWLGSDREVDVYVSDEPPSGGESRPIALIGAELLSPHLLMVDYAAMTVDIETQD